MRDEMVTLRCLEFELSRVWVSSVDDMTKLALSALALVSSCAGTSTHVTPDATAHLTPTFKMSVSSCFKLIKE
jgi:hypothetical protein